MKKNSNNLKNGAQFSSRLHSSYLLDSLSLRPIRFLWWYAFLSFTPFLSLLSLSQPCHRSLPQSFHFCLRFHFFLFPNQRPSFNSDSPFSSRMNFGPKMKWKTINFSRYFAFSLSLSLSLSDSLSLTHTEPLSHNLSLSFLAFASNHSPILGSAVLGIQHFRTFATCFLTQMLLGA